MSAATDGAALLVWLAIAGVLATTLATRASFIVLGARWRLPEVVERALRYAPACALAAIVGPDVLAHGGAPVAGLENFRLPAAIAAAIAFALTRSMLWTIGVGMTVFTALRLWA